MLQATAAEQLGGLDYRFDLIAAAVVILVLAYVFWPRFTKGNSAEHKPAYVGTVASFDPKLGCGVITASNGGGAIILTEAELRRVGLSTIAEGQAVEFDIIEEHGTRTAANLRVPGIEDGAISNGRVLDDTSAPSSPNPNPDRARVYTFEEVLAQEQEAIGRRRSQNANRRTGTVKWFNSVKGFGFIQPNNGEKDVFVHISAVERAGLKSLQEGQTVEYDLVSGRAGRTTAENLSVR